jgi:L-tryptophan--pyruvate aminotransferase
MLFQVLSSSLFLCRWALVRDPEIAKKMTKYIELNTIGVSKDSQIRASRVLRAVRRTYDLEHHHQHHHHSRDEGSTTKKKKKNGHGLFDFGYREMESRWAQLQAAISPSRCFNVSSPMSGHCSFFGRETTFNPGKYQQNPPGKQKKGHRKE